MGQDDTTSVQVKEGVSVIHDR